MIIPIRNGRPMRLIKQYDRFGLYVDDETGVRECFTQQQLLEFSENQGLAKDELYLFNRNITDSIFILDTFLLRINEMIRTLKN